MKKVSGAGPKRKLIALTISGLILIILVTIGGYGLIRGFTSTPDTERPDPATSSSADPISPSTVIRPEAPRIIPTNDPELFARRVAEALFTWDTAAGLVPLDYTAAILNVGDPSGHEQAGLAADIATYLPTRDAWVELRKYETTQRIEIDTVVVPNAWNDALAQANPSQLPPGATAYTIDATRHRDGAWNGNAQVVEASISFTVFIACPPDHDPCYLLRLSQLDNPLR